MKYLLILSAFALFLVSCGQDSTSSEAEDDIQVTEESENGEMDGDGIHYGEKIDEDGAIGLHELMLRMEEQDSVYTKVIAEVDDVCQKKGCWMNVYAADREESERLFVQFHDYAFFMPLDLQGEVVLEGVAYRDVTSVEELQHYAEDAGESEEAIAAITEPEEQLKFMATGVKILQ
jgi:hypothetical protein